MPASAEHATAKGFAVVIHAGFAGGGASREGVDERGDDGEDEELLFHLLGWVGGVGEGVGGANYAKILISTVAIAD